MKTTGIPMLLRMAFRNLSRHRVKSALTITAVAVSCAVYIFVDAMLYGMNLETKRNIVNYETAAAKLQTRAYFDDKDDLPMYESFDGWQPYADALSQAGYDTAPRFVWTGSAITQDTTGGLMLIGIDPAADTRILDYANYIDMGRFIEDGQFEMAMGANAAEKLKCGVPQRPVKSDLDEALSMLGDDDAAFARGLYEVVTAGSITAAITDDTQYALKKDVTKDDLNRLWAALADTGRMDITISTTIDNKKADGDINHTYQVIQAKLVGTVNSPDPANNESVAWMPLSVLQDEAGMMLDGHITELLIRGKNAPHAELPGKAEDAAAITAALGKLPDGLDVFGWLRYCDDYIAISNADNVSTNIMILMLFILSFLGIANTMTMSMLERTKEFGMMRSMGMTGEEVMLATVAEAGFIGLIGAAIGVALGSLVNIYMVNVGLNFRELSEMGGDYGYRVTSIIKSAWNIPVVVIVPLLATALSAATALLPARSAARMEITESLRFE